MTTRRQTLKGLAASWFGVMSLHAFAEQRKRIVIISGGSRAATRHLFDAFEAGLREAGFTPGKSVSLEYRFVDGKFAQLPSLAAEILAGKPDLVLAHTTPAATAAKRTVTEIPIVIVGVADPVGAGLVDNLARPGGNVTGVTNITVELTGKRLGLMKELLPQLTSIAVILNPDDPVAKLQMNNASDAARSLNLRLQPVLELRKPDELASVFASAAKSNASAAIRMVDPLNNIVRKPFVELAAKHKLPIIYPFREDAEAGGLISYGTSQREQFGQAALFAAKVLRGARPRDLPVEQPTKFELVINRRTASALGLTIPQSLLISATRVIE